MISVIVCDAYADEYKLIDKTFDFVSRNVRVNGRNFEDLNQKEEGIVAFYASASSVTHAYSVEMEPFDEALDRRIWSMASSRFEWENNLSEVRLTRPTELTEELREMIHKRDKADTDHDASYEMNEDDDHEDEVMPDFEEAMRNALALGQELSQV